MIEQNQNFQSAYGEAMLYAHLIEDLLAMHLHECSYFKINNYTGISQKTIREMKHEERINELLKIYSKQNEHDNSITRLVTALHHIRKIRNHIAHAFVPQVGSDLTTEEGVDQILAMLNEISYWERGWLNALKIMHESVLKHAVINQFDAIMKREEPPFNARVSKSKIKEGLNSLREQLKE